MKRLNVNARWLSGGDYQRCRFQPGSTQRSKSSSDTAPVMSTSSWNCHREKTCRPALFAAQQDYAGFFCKRIAAPAIHEVPAAAPVIDVNPSMLL
jgi:hypothetical protein